MIEERRLKRLNATLERLNLELAETHINSTDIDTLVIAIRNAEAKIKTNKLNNLIKVRNRQRVEKIELLKLVWAVKFPSVDNTIDSGHFHKTKQKKIEGLPELLAVHQYTTASFCLETNTYDTIKPQGNDIYLRRYQYNGAKKATNFESFEQFAEYNGATLKPFTAKQVLKSKAKIEKAYLKLKAEREKYSAVCKGENVYSMEIEGFVSRYTVHDSCHYV